MKGFKKNGALAKTGNLSHKCLLALPQRNRVKKRTNRWKNAYWSLSDFRYRKTYTRVYHNVISPSFFIRKPI